MTIFVDASALVAIIMQEEGHIDLSRRVDADEMPIWSALSRWETARALARLLKTSITQAAEIADLFVGGFYTLVPIGRDEADLAAQAHQQFGKGNHRAHLNMGDCFAYACAKTNGAKLLYKGDDFSQTDLA